MNSSAIDSDCTNELPSGRALGAAPCSPVAVLFVRADSVYKSIEGVDAWDAERNALRWSGGMPIVAHPPCRAWGRLKHMANPRPGERELALWAVCMVRIWGGVLEHPAGSGLWEAAKLPPVGERDGWGGWTLAAPQSWWGHRAEKKTRFYIIGCQPNEIPSVPIVLGDAPCVIANGTTNHIPQGESGWRPEVHRWEREATPPALAVWLVELARICRANGALSNGGTATNE